MWLIDGCFELSSGCSVSFLDNFKTSAEATKWKVFFVGSEMDNDVMSSPLIAAVVAGDLTTVQSLLDTGADKNETMYHGCSAMWLAAGQGHLDIMQLLLEQGAEKDQANDEGLTPLLAAADFGHLVIVQALLGQGVDKEQKITMVVQHSTMPLSRDS